MDREKLREARVIAGWAHLDKKSGTGNSTGTSNRRCLLGS